MSEEELLLEAKKIKDEANKKAKLLTQKAKELKQKKLEKLGELTVKFLKDEIVKDELTSFAVQNKFIEKKEQFHG